MAAFGGVVRFPSRPRIPARQARPAAAVDGGDWQNPEIPLSIQATAETQDLFAAFARSASHSGKGLKSGLLLTSSAEAQTGKPALRMVSSRRR